MLATRYFGQYDDYLRVGGEAGKFTFIVGDLSRDGSPGGGRFSESQEQVFSIRSNVADDAACGAFAASLYREVNYGVGMLDFIVQDAPPQVVIAFAEVQWATPLPRRWKPVADRLAKLCRARLSASGFLRGGLRAYF